jgi:CheY-specific phosphatase CheX
MAADATTFVDLGEEEAEAFINAVKTVCAVLLGLQEVEAGAPRRGPAARVLAEHHTRSAIHLRSDQPRTLSLLFPEQTLKAIALRLFGSYDEKDRADIQDCLGELANQVGGAAKAVISQRLGLEIGLGLPVVHAQADGHWPPLPEALGLTIPFTSAVGPFAISVWLGSHELA